MKNLNIYRPDLMKKIKSGELSKDWKKIVAMMGVGTFLLTPTFLMGCENNNGGSEAVDEPPKVEEPEDEKEVNEELEKEESLAINREELSEEEFLIKLWDIVNSRNYGGPNASKTRGERIVDFTINFEHFKNLAHESRPFYYLEDFQNPETGEMVKIDELIEEHGEYWGPIMYAREMSREDKTKIAIFFNYSESFLSISEPYSRGIRHDEDSIHEGHFLFPNSFEQFGSLKGEENPFVLLNVPRRNYSEMLDQHSIRDAGNADHFFAMPYLTPSRKGTTIEPRYADLQTVADDQLAIFVGYQIGLFNMRTEILDEQNVEYYRHVDNMDFFEKINKLNIEHYGIDVDYEYSKNNK